MGKKVHGIIRSRLDMLALSDTDAQRKGIPGMMIPRWPSKDPLCDARASLPGLFFSTHAAPSLQVTTGGGTGPVGCQLDNGDGLRFQWTGKVIATHL